jgi:hypothetical protein
LLTGFSFKRYSNSSLRIYSADLLLTDVTLALGAVVVVLAATFWLEPLHAEAQHAGPVGQHSPSVLATFSVEVVCADAVDLLQQLVVHEDFSDVAFLSSDDEAKRLIENTIKKAEKAAAMRFFMMKM